MGDRCNVSLRCRREHVKIFEEELGFSEEPESEGGMASLENGECNYAYRNQLKALAERGIPFVAKAGAGSGYGASEMVGCEGEFGEIECLQDSGPAVPVDEFGSPNAEALEAAKRFGALKRRAFAAIEA